MAKRKGTGGKGKRALAGRGPTPKAEDRPYHKAYKNKQSLQGKPRGQKVAKRKATTDYIAGRNSVVEALRADIPVKTLYVSKAIEVDNRVREAINLAGDKNLPVLEASKFEMDRLTNGAVHQGLVLQIPAYKYADPIELIEKATDKKTAPLLVALDGITDPRNLGAILRSVSAFGADGVIIPERRSVGMTASAWKTSAGAGSRVQVAQAKNLNSAIKQIKKQGVFVVGLDMNADVELPKFDLATEPLLLVVGAEGEGLSRLTRELCDQIVGIPMHTATESLNASVAAGITLYQINTKRNL
ncbi:MAG: 23S rRNA (guanosine(2251)-2'-O)-methyltransferase RlmB [Micrococcaceae bacterium]